MRVHIAPYSPSWPEHFSLLSASLSKILPSGSYLSIEHVGSTSVPGLPAKPIIDIDIIIPSASNLEPVKEALIRSKREGGGGYTFFGERGVPGRYAFLKPRQPRAEGENRPALERAKNVDVVDQGVEKVAVEVDRGKDLGMLEGKREIETTEVAALLYHKTDEMKDQDQPKHNLYVCLDGCLSLRNHLAVRQVCRNDEEARKKYADFKIELAKRDWKDLDEYSQAKSEVLAWVLERGGIGKEDIKSVKSINKT